MSLINCRLSPEYQHLASLVTDNTLEPIDGDHVVAWVTRRVESFAVSKMQGLFRGHAEGTLIFTIEHDLLHECTVGGRCHPVPAGSFVIINRLGDFRSGPRRTTNASEPEGSLAEASQKEALGTLISRTCWELNAKRRPPQ